MTLVDNFQSATCTKLILLAWWGHQTQLCALVHLNQSENVEGVNLITNFEINGCRKSNVAGRVEANGRQRLGCLASNI